MARNTKKLYVIDASVILSLLLPDEKSIEGNTKVLAIFDDKDSILISTNLLPYEVFNGVKNAYIRKRISKVTFHKIIKVFNDLPIKLKENDIKKTLKITVNKSLTYYDASYLELKNRFKAKLITFDTHLIPYASI